MKKLSKRILTVKLKHEYDESPDTSHLGEYSHTRTSEYSIDRMHTSDCAILEVNHMVALDKLEHILQHVFQLRRDAGNDETSQSGLDDALDIIDDLQRQVSQCNCAGGDFSRNEFRYFNPSFNYVDDKGKPVGLTPDQVREYTRQDYERMERLMKGYWNYIGIRAVAQVVTGDTVQTITSGGLWGTESDSEASYLKEIEHDELVNLKDELVSLGFSKRAISKAFKSVTEETA